MENKMLYVVFSATPLKMGTVIRGVTRGKYNHVSISFSPDLKELYSYARLYKETPFVGGFVKETPCRYKNKDRVADICICALPVEDEKYNRVVAVIEEMSSNPEDYKYNMYSAATSVVSKRVHIPKCMTCIEFVVFILSMVTDKVSSNKFYNIEDLRKLIAEYEIYSGPFPDIDSFEKNGDYHRSFSLVDKLKLSANFEIDLAHEFMNRNKT